MANDTADVNGETDCKMRCIEYETFDCKVAYYSSQYGLAMNSDSQD